MGMLGGEMQVPGGCRLTAPASLILACLLACLLLCPVQVTAAGQDVTVVLFLNQHCSECHKAILLLDNFTLTHPGVIVKQFDIYDNETNRLLFQEYNERYGTPHSYVPAVFVGKRALVGMPEIETGLGDEITALRANATAPGDLLPLFPSGLQGMSASGLTVPVVIAAALVDGINPCAFAVMVFLLLTLLAIDTRRKVILTGSVYILAVFLFYFLSGLGLFAFVQFAGVSRLLAVIATFVAIAAGIISLWDAFRKDESSPLLAIPGSKKGIIDRYAAKAGIPAAFILGILVGMFELPCTGGIYIAILALLSTQMALAAGIPLLLLYNVFFIVPLVVILLVVSFGVPVEKLEEWRSGHRRSVRILMGLVLIALGVVMLATLF